MNWDAIGAVGEIIGALAVFLTLIYLAIQIRQNTKAVHASANHVSVSEVNQVRTSLYENADLCGIYVHGSALPEKLDEEERVRFRLLLHNIFLSVSNTYAQTTLTGLPLSTWESQKTILKRILSSPGGKWFWSETRLEFEESFRVIVDEILEE